MIGPPEDRRGGITPQLAIRVAVAGSFALLLFAIVFFRLWFLQVLSSNHYITAASQNKIRTSAIPAPRGEITDRDGNVLVKSNLAFDVEIEPGKMPVPIDGTNILNPPHKDWVVYQRLEHNLHISGKRTSCTIVDPDHPTRKKKVQLSFIACKVAYNYQHTPYDNAVVVKNATTYVQNYVQERQNLYPGVTVTPVYQRQYPEKSLAAQLLGTVGPITAGSLGLLNPNAIPNQQDVDHSHFKGLKLNATIGQTGLEYQYDAALRGVDGEQRVEVNAVGQFEGDLAPKEPTVGDTLKTTIDSKLQSVAQQSLATSIAQVNAGGGDSDGGAFVAMNPDNGQIYAMGSEPTYNPAVLQNISESKFKEYFQRPGEINPQIDQALQSPGPTGSTFKVITATAALESHNWTPDETFDDTGKFCEGGGLCIQNSGGAAYGIVNMVKAIQVSDDIFFYNLGFKMNVDKPEGGPLQEWAGKFGIGRSTGVDLPGGADGQVESPSEVARLVSEQKECLRGAGPYKGRSPSTCDIADPNAVWTQGDNVNAAVGQGDDQVTPLQLAVVYSALANGGNIITPHVGMDIQSTTGQIIQKINPGIRRKLHINPTYLSTILAGLRAAASSGTSGDVMGTFGMPVYGKTGTAQYIKDGVEQDYAWYACFVPKTATSKPIAVVVTVRKGGFGDVAAAPVARQILSQWFYGKPGAYKSGSSSDT